MVGEAIREISASGNTLNNSQIQIKNKPISLFPA